MAADYAAVRIVVSGVVQGVGFRWHVKRSADIYGLKGFVRNLPNGAVETVAEGDKSAVNGFINEVKIGPRSAHVRGADIDWIEYSGEYHDFKIIL